MARTLQDKFLLALLAKGEHEVKRTHKFIVLSRAAGGHYYLGRAGSLRYGQTVVGSVPCSQKFKDALIAKENTIGNSA